MSIGHGGNDIATRCAGTICASAKEILNVCKDDAYDLLPLGYLYCGIRDLRYDMFVVGL